MTVPVPSSPGQNFGQLPNLVGANSGHDFFDGSDVIHGDPARTASRCSWWRGPEDHRTLLAGLPGDRTLVVGDQLRLHVEAELRLDEIFDCQRFGILAQLGQGS